MLYFFVTVSRFLGCPALPTQFSCGSDDLFPFLDVKINLQAITTSAKTRC